MFNNDLEVLLVHAERHRRGLTDQECQRALVMGAQSQTPARDRLEKAGHITWNGTTKRRTESGRQARVYRITASGRAEAAVQMERISGGEV